MDGMTVQAEYDTDGADASPLKLRTSKVGWMMLRAKDKAGNMTRPYRYPVIESTADEDRSKDPDDQKD